MRGWQPSLGAWLAPEGVRFRVWAPRANLIEVMPEGSRQGQPPWPLSKQADGTFTGLATGWQAGDSYRYRIDGAGIFPDPASRFQPHGVHGSSQVIDPAGFRWTDA